MFDLSDFAGLSTDRDVKQEKLKRILKDELHAIVRRGKIRCRTKPDTKLLNTFSVTKIQLNGDNSFAKVHINVSGSPVERRQVFIWLTEQSRMIRHALHTSLRHLKTLPFITFHLVSMDRINYMNTILDEILDERERARESRVEGREQEDETEEEEEFADFEEISLSDQKDNAKEEVLVEEDES